MPLNKRKTTGTPSPLLYTSIDVSMANKFSPLEGASPVLGPTSASCSAGASGYIRIAHNASPHPTPSEQKSGPYVVVVDLSEYCDNSRF